MKKLFWVVLIVSSAASLFAAEGKWTPQQVLELDPKWLKEQGLELPPERLWDPRSGTGLLSATISTGGCSSGFVSAEGLFVTNHHCLFSVLQEHATPQNDIITNGFVARSRDQELRSKTLRVTMPRRFTDVTKDVLSAVPKNATDAQRFRAIEKKSAAIVAQCEKQPRTRCRVAAHDGGLQYVLQEMTEFDDVRLVYAPPRAVGEFGGEVDNWMWPRHTGDFAIGRVWFNGAPYKPGFFFPVSREGVKPNDFVMVMGYPGITYRALTASEMEERKIWFERRAKVYREWIDLLESTTASSPEGKIAVADLAKTLANRQKNAEGQLAGFARWSTIGKQRTLEGQVKTTALAGLQSIASEKIATFDHDFLLDHLRMTGQSLALTGPKSLIWAVAVARSATERAKPEADRDEVFAARNITRVRDRIEREQKSFFAPADKAHLASFVRMALALPQGQRIAAIDQLFAGKDVNATIDQLYANSRLVNLSDRLSMFDMSAAQLRARRDPLLDLGFALSAEISAMNERRDGWEGAISRLRPEWRRAQIAHAGRPIAPDANSTLRVSFAHVKGYQPRDGVWFNAQTTLAGVLEKHTGAEPFDVPEAIRTAGASQPGIPVAFLSDADTTGGNSGSPTINARGQLVGVNFDRVWENVS
ncbi:MAG TPA: S46 family peptidase, partial [Thermoanaerobaculia bacterium]